MIITFYLCSMFFIASSAKLSKIFGGNVVNTIEDFPYVVSLVRQYNASNDLRMKLLCTATIISRNHILTAAHCLIDKSNRMTDVSMLAVHAGSLVPQDATSVVKIKDVYVHPNYERNKKEGCYMMFDVAVLLLENPLNFSSTISRVNLPAPVSLESQLYPLNLLLSWTNRLANKGAVCQVLGWGKTEDKDEIRMFSTLKVVDVPLINVFRCKREMDSRIFTNIKCLDSIICSQEPCSQAGPRGGDSGGPLICEGKQVGVTSYLSLNTHCTSLTYMYARVDSSLHWIESVMKDK